MLKQFGESGKIEFWNKEHSRSDLKGVYIIFVGVNSKDVVKGVIRDAHKKGTLCDIVDAQGNSDFLYLLFSEMGS